MNTDQELKKILELKAELNRIKVASDLWERKADAFIQSLGDKLGIVPKSWRKSSDCGLRAAAGEAE